MFWQYALVGPHVGLQFIGQHPRSRSSLPQMLTSLVAHGIGTMQAQLDTALLHPADYTAYPTDIIDPAHTLFVPRRLVTRLSKWCDHAGAGETDARKFTRALFRHSNELLTIPPRLLDQADRPIVPPAAFEEWADRVIAAWGGTPSKPPAITAALGAW